MIEDIVCTCLVLLICIIGIIYTANEGAWIAVALFIAIALAFIAIMLPIDW